jgi:hypothetical protein
MKKIYLFYSYNYHDKPSDYFFAYPKTIINAVTIINGSNNIPKNTDSIPTINEAINARMKIPISHI